MKSDDLYALFNAEYNLHGDFPYTTKQLTTNLTDALHGCYNLTNFERPIERPRVKKFRPSVSFLYHSFKNWIYIYLFDIINERALNMDFF